MKAPFPLLFVTLMACAHPAAQAQIASKLPSRDASVVIPLLQPLESPTTEAVEKILGPYDEDIGSGIFVFRYELSEGSRILVGSSKPPAVSYIRHLKSDNTEETIYETHLLPSHDPSAVIPCLKRLESPTIAAVENVLGNPDAYTGSGIVNHIYRLSEGSSLFARIMDGENFISITWIKPDETHEAIYSMWRSPD